MTLFDFIPSQPKLEELKITITRHNMNYRAGVPDISDEKYDQLLEQYRNQVSSDDYLSFIRTLTEIGGDVKHPYTVGSLNKVKFGEDQLACWLNKYSQTTLIQAKIDGLSFVAKYVVGTLTLSATRGDGFTGTDITHKMIHILPQKLNKPVTIDVRGEISLTGEDHIKLGFKNRRNGSVGLINRDNALVDDVKHLKAFACQIKSGHCADRPIIEQLQELENLGFNLPAHQVVSLDPATGEEVLAGILTEMKHTVEYDIDGLVLCGTDYCLEDDFLPTGMIAFKVDQDAVGTTVLDIEWNVSKNGLLKPVVLVEPRDIDGTTVGRVTGYNAQWLTDNGIGAGASVGIIKSGEIIPKIVEVYKAAPVVLIHECPSCGMSLKMNSVDLVCDNEFCSAAGTKEVESFLVKLGIEGVRDTTLGNWGINSISDLLEWKAGSAKSENNLAVQLGEKLFNAPADKLFGAMLFDGFGRKSVAKIIEFFGSRFEATSAIRSVSDGQSVDLPEGFGVISVTKVAASWERNLETLGRIVADPRWTEPVVEEKQESGSSLAGMSFLFTGTISMPRKQAESMVTDNGGKIASGVSKNLNYLIAGAAAGSKLDKANKLNIPVLTEQEFAQMVGVS